VTHVTNEQVDQLAERVTGPVLRPGDEGYPGEAEGFNLAFRHRPALIVGAANASDVQQAVRFAGDHGLPVAVVATGHGPAVVADGAVMITTWRMTDMMVDPVRQVARVEAGVRWRRAVDRAATVGLAPLCGSSPTVGVVGYTLGGGLSVTMGRAHGWASDQVRSLDVVTTDGELRHVSAESDPDLLWALRREEQLRCRDGHGVRPVPGDAAVRRRAVLLRRAHRGRAPRLPGADDARAGRADQLGGAAPDARPAGGT
jgi:hypothetical protein